MLLPVPKTSSWSAFIQKRFSEAKAVGLFRKDVASPLNLWVVVPDEISQIELDVLDPEGISLRELRNEVKSTPRDGWVLRNDLFLEASEVLYKFSASGGYNKIVWEAGYQDHGDSILSSRDNLT
jgi:hypothetical protein